MSRPPPRATLTDSLSPSTTLFRSRARLRYPDLRAPGGKVDVQGFTLPGLPAAVVGSNGHVAWAFTNSYVDSTDWKRVVPCAPAKPAPDRQRSASGKRVSVRVELGWRSRIQETTHNNIIDTYPQTITKSK